LRKKEMELSIIDAGDFKLDGGAMFGVVPKSIWQKMVPADANNMCSWKMRCLLVDTGGKLVLIDTGMGEKQSEKWQGHYYRHGSGDLITSIRKAGYHESDVTDVVLTHLHFDHCGGGVKWNARQDAFQLTFQNANYWTHSGHWNWAMAPNPREKATFLSENLSPILESGHLKFIDQNIDYFGSEMSFLFADGHTEKMIMPVIRSHGKQIIFAADTIPSFAHIHVPYCMSYDVRPLTTMVEKENLLDKVASEGIILVFDHDIENEAAIIEKTERGFKPKRLGTLNDLINN
jgi:glyoxylase-like metal-dependent hydrolase (beta-lactamase superfamily II)